MESESRKTTVIACPKCPGKIKIYTSDLGRVFRCSKCGTLMSTNSTSPGTAKSTAKNSAPQENHFPAKEANRLVGSSFHKAVISDYRIQQQLDDYLLLHHCPYCNSDLHTSAQGIRKNERYHEETCPDCSRPYLIDLRALLQRRNVLSTRKFERAQRQGSHESILASPESRLIAYILDLLLHFLVILLVSITFWIGAKVFQRPTNGSNFYQAISNWMAYLLILGPTSYVIYWGIQFFYVIRSSQTFGKKLLRLQIVDYDTGIQAGWMRIILTRHLVPTFILSMIAFIPFIGALLACVLAIADIICIFKSDRRTIHDLMARTSVVSIA
jgi:uncharacterized RDD family membrane protein YckC